MQQQQQQQLLDLTALAAMRRLNLGTDLHFQPIGRAAVVHARVYYRL
jgi:hypothetical protein